MDKSIGQMMDEKPMAGFQWAVIGLCFLINMLDGFDVLVMAFTAASVSSEWALTGTRLGCLLSAGLVYTHQNQGTPAKAIGEPRWSNGKFFVSDRHVPCPYRYQPADACNRTRYPSRQL
jgi:hypothetical protein